MSKQEGIAVKDEAVNHRHLLPGSVTDSVLKRLQGAAPGYLTSAEIAEATGWGAKAVAWAVFLLRRKGLIKGRQRGVGLEYRASLAHEDRELEPKPMETLGARQDSDCSAVPENLCGARTRAGTPCRLHAMYFSTRCKFHGGKSTGPKTEAGKEQARINGRKGGRPRKEGRNPSP